MRRQPVDAEWKRLAEAASSERDPQKLMQLIEQLTQILAKEDEIMPPSARPLLPS